MKKEFIGCLVALPALLGLGLTSCSNEDLVSGQQVDNRELTHVTIEASIGVDSRASLTPEQKTLKFAWDVNDKIEVVNADNGERIGTMKVGTVDAENPRKCMFAGDLALPKTDANLKLYYLGQKGTMTSTSDFKPQDLEFDFSAQTGVKEAMDDYDILKADVAFKASSTTFHAIFNRFFSYGRFVLHYNGKEVDVIGKEITIAANSGNCYNKATLDFVAGEYTKSEGAVKVTPEEGNSFYITMLPSDQVNFLFTVDTEDGVFVGTSGAKVGEGLYYSADGGAPIIVEMKHQDGSDDTRKYSIVYNQNFGENPATFEDAIEAVGNKATATVLTYVATNLPEVKGYDFKGWYTNAECTGEQVGATYELTYNGEEVTSATLYAKWEKTVNTYTLNWKTRDGDMYDQSTLQSYDDPYNWTLVAPEGVNPTAPQGYKFAGWADKAVDPDKVVEKVTFSKERMEIDVIPVFVEKTYTYTLIFEYISTADNATYVELDRKEIEGVDGLPVTLSDYHAEAMSKFPYKDNWIGWAIKDGKISEIPTVTFDQTNATITVVAMTKWDIKFVDELDPSHVYQPYPRSNYLYTWNFKNLFPSDPTKDGYEFLGWYYNDKKVTSPNQIVLTRDNFEPRVYARWKIAKPSTVSTSGYGHGSFVTE